MNRIRKAGGSLALTLELVLGVAGVSHAIEATSPMSYVNGVISIGSTIPASLGGTGLTATTDDAVMVGNGSVYELKVLTDCNGATDAVTYDTATNTWGCNTITASSVYPDIDFNADGQLDQNGSTLYIGPGGKVSATETSVSMPIGAATLTNLRCKSDTTVGGTSLVVTLGSGACSGVTFGSVTVTPISADTVVADTSNTESVGAGECVVLRAVATGDTAAMQLSCSVQKTANS